MKHKTLLLRLLLLVLFLGCKKDHNPVPLKDEYPLPGDKFFPEGIAYDHAAAAFYTGSSENGDIVKVDVITGAVSLFSPGATKNRNSATGMKVDKYKRLWVCGGADNKIHVLDKDGSVLKTWDTQTMFGSGFINDVALDSKYAYFTDSREQHIYRAAISEDVPNELELWFEFTNNEIPYVQGFNANGAVLTKDGKYLIIVISASGKLYRINRNTKDVIEIMLNEPITASDGLWLDGKDLYTSRNSFNQIHKVILNQDYRSGTVQAPFGNGLKFPTTIAKVGNELLVVNGQLNRRPSATNPNPPPPDLPFTVSTVRIP